MLTIKMLKDMPPQTIFATGVEIDNFSGLNMSGSGKNLRWVAVRGVIHDWTIYAHWSFHDVEWIKKQGDKVVRDSHIKMLVPCDDEAFALYRF